MNNLSNLKNGREPSPLPPTVKRNQVTSAKEMEQCLIVLQSNKDRWVITNIDERIAILDDIKRDLIALSDRWVALSIEAKGIPQHSYGEGEEWTSLGGIYGLIASLRQSLADIKKYGSPRIAGPITMRSDNQTVVRVFPQTLIERIMFPGLREEVWMEPGIFPEETLISQARVYKDPDAWGAVCLVLGAGNVSTLPITDIFHRLFIANHVVILKLNPVNDYLGPLMEKGFSVLIKRGFLRIVYGGAAEGTYLCHHPLVDEVHVTGSDKTFETIVFGSDSNSERKTQKRPLISKPVTGELGNITPVIIVPGPWSDSDIRKQAEKITTGLAVNAGCNCLTPRVIVQQKNWSKREALIKAIGKDMANLETRKAYYPGAVERHAAYIATHPDALLFGDTSQGHLPWTFIPDIDPKNENDICFKKEAFCSLLAETALDAPNIPEFIDRAVDFVNGTLWGTLTVSIVIHPKSLCDPKVAVSLERALVNLHYGTIFVNEWGALANPFPRTPWGGFPGSDIYNVQSGIGFVNNTLMFSRPQKTVIRGPFKKTPDITRVTFRHFHSAAKKFATYLASPSIWKIPGLAWIEFQR